MPTSVVLIDPNKLFREGIKALIAGSDFQIVAETGSPGEVHTIQAVSQTGGAPPQLVLFDPGGTTDALQVVGLLRDAFPDARLVLLTTEMDTHYLAAVLQAGADGYLMKDLSPEALLQSLRLVMLGEKVFPTHLAALLVSGRVRSDTAAMPSPRGLSRREVEIMRHLVHGDSNKMIANHLKITEATVKVHLKSLLRKIGASNRTQAAIWALNNGLSDNAHTLTAAG
jgi:two-component system nitrate/nitrite response regulator NarL